MPVTTTGLAILMGGSTALNVIGANQAAKGAKRQGAYEAALLNTEATYADQQAKDAIEIGKEQESRHMAAVRQLIGEQRTTLAGSGVDISTGSARDIQEDSAFLGELDRNTIANNARREAWGFRVQAADLRNRAKLAKAGAQNMAAGYRNQAMTSLIGGAAQIGSLYRSNR